MNPGIIALLVVAFVILLMVLATRKKRARARRSKFIASYAFPQTLRFKLDQAYPELSHEQSGMVLEGLRTWFSLLAANPRANLGMPSKAVDTAWHEFILLTKDYADFCDKAFAKFLHHTPHKQRSAQRREGLARTYGLGAAAVAGGAVGVGLVGVAAASAMSGRDLFSLDHALGINDGKEYSPEYLDKLEREFETLRASGHSDGGSGGGSDSSWGGSDSKSHGSDSSSDSGGSSCGGGGCGGGGGGC